MQNPLLAWHNSVRVWTKKIGDPDFFKEQEEAVALKTLSYCKAALQTEGEIEQAGIEMTNQVLQAALAADPYRDERHMMNRQLKESQQGIENKSRLLSLLMHILAPIAAIPALIGMWSQRFPALGGLVLACPAIATLLLHRFVIG